MTVELVDLTGDVDVFFTVVVVLVVAEDEPSGFLSTNGFFVAATPIVPALVGDLNVEVFEIVVAGRAAVFVTVVVFDAGSIVLLTVFRTVVVVVVVDGPSLDVVVGEILFAVAVVADSFEIGALAVGADDVSVFFSTTALGTLGFT